MAQGARAAQGAHTGDRTGSPRKSARPARNARKLVVAACLVVAVALFAFALFGGEGLFGGGSAGTYVAYLEFAQDVDEGRVAKAVIGQDSVTFSLVDDAMSYYTDNPGSPDFRERLLMAGVSVGTATSADEVFNRVLDLLIVLMILGPLAFGVWRLVSLDRSTFKVVRKTGVTFADIAGMPEVKRELSRVVGVLKDPGAYARCGVRPVKGVILEGPPGNGKTLFARALASEAGVSFIATKGADFQSALMSLGAAKIRTLFRKAARHRPCIVFIDEFDSIGERRNYAGTGVDKENNRIITAMLNEMDGFEGKDGVLVVAATNSYRSLDPALVRPGRFDLKFTVGNPDAATRAELVRLYTEGAGRALAPDVDPAALVAMFGGLSCAAIETCLNGAATVASAEAASAPAEEASSSVGAGASGGAGGARGVGADAGRPGAAITMAQIRAAAARAGVTLKG